MQKAQHGESETQLQRACRKLWTVTLELPEFDSTAYVRRAVSRAMTLPLRIRERAAGGDDGFKPRLASIRGSRRRARLRTASHIPLWVRSVHSTSILNLATCSDPVLEAPAISRHLTL